MAETTKKAPEMKIVDPEGAVPVEVLAAAIVRISDGMKKLLAGPLKRRALLLLIHDAVPTDRSRLAGYSKVSITDIGRVLDAIESLRARHVK